jgi:hypothetical protein
VIDPGGRYLLVDVGELGVAIGMIAPLAGLAIGLQTIAERTQQLADHTVADLMAKFTQSSGQLAQALRRPQQRRLRIAAGRRFNQAAQIIEQRRILDRQRLASAARPPYPIRLGRRAVPQFEKLAPDRAARHAGNLRDDRNPTTACRQRFRRRIPPTATLVQKRIERLKPNPNRFVVNHESFLYPSSRKGNPSAELFVSLSTVSRTSASCASLRNGSKSALSKMDAEHVAYVALRKGR